MFEDTRRHVETVVQELEGEQDFLPLMAVRNHRDELAIAGLMMPDEADAKNFLADTMAAICTLHRATEVAFTSVAWMVAPVDGKMPDLPPSQCADRQEIVMITMVDAEGEASIHTAAMVREAGKCGVGLWEEMPGAAKGAGRFVNAIRLGIAMGQKIPPDMCDYLDREIAEGNSEKLVNMMVKTYGFALGRDRDGGVQK